MTSMIKGAGRNLAAIIGLFAVYLPRLHRLHHAVQRSVPA